MLFLKSNNSWDENLALIKHLFCLFFQDALFISQAVLPCHLPLKQIMGLVWLYPFNYQWVISMMPLKIKIGVLRLNPFILQQVTLIMPLEHFNRLAGGMTA
jgi:hypothetical protein